MPAKRSTRFAVKPYMKQLAKQFDKHFAMKHFMVKRPAAIGIIVVCIVGTAILIVARSSEPTSAASVTPAVETTAAAPINQAAPVAKTQKPFVLAKAPAAQEPGTVAGAQVATIEGCLIQGDQQFQLKNTSGEDAPKGRSWKSGFLHKGSKTVDVMDPNHRMNLAHHVGERVTITGMLDDRELQGTYLKRVAESCK
jgi:hypothetical protein